MPTPLLPRLAAALCTALALSACGGSHHHDSQADQPPPTGGTPPVAANDSFFDYVMARVTALVDNEEPAAIDAVTETKPEDTEPKPVG
jgi:hypothetical protein